MEKPTQFSRDFTLRAPTKPKLGVIVGRFQVASLHEGHKQLIQTALDDCGFALILLGVAQERSWKNPLSAPARAQMIGDWFGRRVSYQTIQDMPEADELWAQQLDEKLEEISQLWDITLYGSRDSFLTNLPYFNDHKWKRKIIQPVADLAASKTRVIEFELLLIEGSVIPSGKSDVRAFVIHHGRVYEHSTLFQVAQGFAGSFKINDFQVLSEDYKHKHPIVGPHIFLSCIGFVPTLVYSHDKALIKMGE